MGAASGPVNDMLVTNLKSPELRARHAWASLVAPASFPI